MDKYQTTVNTFDKFAEQYQNKYMQHEPYVATYQNFCELINDDHAKLLDIACGPGNIAKYLLDQRPGFRLHGIDLAPNMVRLARANNPSATFDVLDSRAISSIDDIFDGVICGFCLPYLSKQDTLKLIADTRKLLKLGGIFYLSTMEDQYHKSGYQNSGSGDQVYMHFHELEYLEAMLVSNGFKIIDIQRKQFSEDQGETATDLFIYSEAV